MIGSLCKLNSNPNTIKLFFWKYSYILLLILQAFIESLNKKALMPGCDPSSGTGNRDLMLLPVLPNEVFYLLNEFLIFNTFHFNAHIRSAHNILNLFSHFFTKQYYISSLLACMMLYKVMNVVSLSSFNQALPLCS